MTATLTGRGVLLWLCAFFGVIFATNILFITLSISTFRGEDEQKPYLQGIEYNQTLARRAEQSELGWRAALSASRGKGGEVVVEVDLRDRAGHPLAGVPLSGELRHPADETRDLALKLSANAPGRYLADAGAISAGYWDVVVASGDAKAPFEATRRIWVP